jgi:hypothetical protein
MTANSTERLDLALKDPGETKTPAVEVLQQIYHAGGHVRVEDDMLHVGPREIVTPELAAQIREHKAAIIATLTTYRCERCGWGVYSKPTICFHCRNAEREAEARADAERILDEQAAAHPRRKRKAKAEVAA